jgi:hypothetical protein
MAKSPTEGDAMLKKLDHLPAGVVGVEASGKVTREDYETVLLPLIDQSYEEGEKLRFLYHFGSAFKGFTPGATWEDFKIGRRVLNRIERCAIVSDVEWIRTTSRFFGALMPCPVRVFSNDQMAEAKAWVAGMVDERSFEFDLRTEQGVLVIEPVAALRAEDFDRLAAVVDPWLERHHDLKGVVVHLNAFPGWDDFESFKRHLRFVRGHHKKVQRLAVSGDGLVASLIPRLASLFVEAEVKTFSGDMLDDAIAWAAEGSERGLWRRREEREAASPGLN